MPRHARVTCVASTLTAIWGVKSPSPPKPFTSHLLDLFDCCLISKSSAIFEKSGICQRTVPRKKGGLPPEGVLSRCSRSAATTQHANSGHQNRTRLKHAGTYPEQALHSRATADLLAGRALLALLVRVANMAAMAGRALSGMRVVFLGAES